MKRLRRPERTHVVWNGEALAQQQSPSVRVRGTVEGVGVAAHARWGHVLGAKFTRRIIRRAPHHWCGTARVLLDGFADRNRDRNHRDV